MPLLQSVAVGMRGISFVLKRETARPSVPNFMLMETMSDCTDSRMLA